MCKGCLMKSCRLHQEHFPSLIRAGGEALPEINGSTNETPVPGVCALGVTCGLMSSVVLTRYMRSLIGVEDIGVCGDIRRQCACGGVAQLRGISGVRCLFRSGDQRSAVDGSSPTTHLWAPFQPRVGGSIVAGSSLFNYCGLRVRAHHGRNH